MNHPYTFSLLLIGLALASCSNPGRGKYFENPPQNAKSQSAISLIIRASEPPKEELPVFKVRKLKYHDDLYEAWMEVPHDLESARRHFSATNGIKYVGLNQMIHPHISKSESVSSAQGIWWQSAVSLDQAWTITQGSQDVIVAVLDSGVAIKHPDLKDNIYVNAIESGPLANPGVDDDGNGVIDDIHGFNFGDQESNVEDDVFPHLLGHGTAVAGLIGAFGDNGIGIKGASPRVTLLPIRVFNKWGIGKVSFLLEGLAYAERMSAKIVNLSIGFEIYDELVHAQLRKLSDHGILIVTSSGDSGTDIDLSPTYPASFDVDTLVAVGGTNPSDSLWIGSKRSSNFGKSSVHIGAPAVSILTTTAMDESGAYGGYSRFDSTSLSAPIVAGTAALMLAKNPNLTGWQLKEKLQASATRIPALDGKIRSGGRLNAYKALTTP